MYKIKKTLSIILNCILVLAMILIPLKQIDTTFAASRNGLYTAYTDSVVQGLLVKKIVIENDKGEKEIGYCYNNLKGYPEKKSPYYELDKYSSVSADNKEQIKKIIYAGYPNNKTHLQEKFHLSDDDFYAITQLAIWTYTDDYSVGSLRIILNNADYTEAEKRNYINAYNELSKINVNIPEKADMFFYKPLDNEYQNILAARFINESRHNENISISVKKLWEGKIKETQAVVELLANGIVKKEATLSDANNWTYTFKDLPKKDSSGSNEIVYTIHEKNEVNNKIRYANNTYTVKVTNDGNKNYVITNRFEEPLVPAKTKVSVTKDWQDYKGDPLADVTVNEVEVELYRDGVTTNQKIKLNKTNQWRGEFINLDVSESVGGRVYAYTIKEVGENNNRVTYGDDGYTVSIRDNGNNNYTLVNKKDRPTIPSTPVVPGTPDKPNTPETPDKPNKPGIPDKPNVPEIPDKPSTPDKPEVPNNEQNDPLPKTGDGANVSMYAWIMLCLGVTLIFISVIRRKSEE